MDDSISMYRKFILLIVDLTFLGAQRVHLYVPRNTARGLLETITSEPQGVAAVPSTNDVNAFTIDNLIIMNTYTSSSSHRCINGSMPHIYVNGIFTCLPVVLVNTIMDVIQ